VRPASLTPTPSAVTVSHTVILSPPGTEEEASKPTGGEHSHRRARSPGKKTEDAVACPACPTPTPSAVTVSHTVALFLSPPHGALVLIARSPGKETKDAVGRPASLTPTPSVVTVSHTVALSPPRIEQEASWPTDADRRARSPGKETKDVVGRPASPTPTPSVVTVSHTVVLSLSPPRGAPVLLARSSGT